MFPVAIDQGVGEERVAILGHPIDQSVPRVVIHRERGRIGSQSGGLNRLVVFLVGRLRDTTLVKDHLLIWETGLFGLLAKRKRRACNNPPDSISQTDGGGIGALDAGTEEQLGSVLELVLNGLDLTVPGDRRVLLDFTGGGNHFADELIVRLVLIQAVPYPSVEGKVSALVGSLGSLVSEQGGPFVGKEVRIFGAVEQLIDQFVSLGRVLVGKEGLGRLDRWQTARDIEGDPANESGVRADLGRRHAHRFKLCEDMFVGVVEGGGKSSTGAPRARLPGKRSPCSENGS